MKTNHPSLFTVLVHVHAWGSVACIQSVSLSKQTWRKKKMCRVIGDSFTTAHGEHKNNNSRASLFYNLCMTLEIEMSLSHLSLCSHFMSPIDPLLCVLLLLYFTISPQCPKRLMQCACIHTLMPKSVGRRRGGIICTGLWTLSCTAVRYPGVT